MKVALQLYSIREYVEKDLFGALEAVQKAGYDGIELAGEYNVTAAALKQKLFEVGLEPMGAHISFERLENRLDEAVEYCRDLGVCSAVCPGADLSDMEKIEKAIHVFERASEKFKQYGIIFGYHNHHRDFKRIGNEYILDILYEKMPKEQLTAEFDTYWIKKGGENPITITKKYADRSLILHAKDMHENGEEADVGCGCIDFKTIVKQLPRLVWIVVEQEKFNLNPFDSIAADCERMKKITE